MMLGKLHFYLRKVLLRDIFSLPPALAWGKVPSTARRKGGPPSVARLASRATFPHKGGRPAMLSAVVFGFAVSLAGCGFHPLYGSEPGESGARQVFASIYVDTIAGERVGYELRNSLIDNLEAAPRPQQATYRLKVTVDQYLQGIAVQNNATVTRYNYTLNANYELSDIHTNKIVKSGIERTLSSYDVVMSPYATLVAQQDAQRRGAIDVASRIQIDLPAYFSRRAAAK